jgi:hypothetical protein
LIIFVKQFTILYQIEIIKELRVNLPDKYIKSCQSSRRKLKLNGFSYHVDNHLKKSNNVLISQLDMLINDNDIEMCLIKDLGFNRTINKGCLNYKMSCAVFENYIFRNKAIKDKVIDNMLYAILLIDYSNYNMK